MYQLKYFILAFYVLLFVPLKAQKQQYSDLREALFSGRQLSGNNGPDNVKWIDGGKRFSYTANAGTAKEIRAFDPVAGSDVLLFSTEGMTFPGTETPFNYRTFQWAGNYQYLLFQTNFQSVWRNSGVSDYYYFSMADKTLKRVAQGAYTAEVSPDGKLVGIEREGDLYIFNFETGKETRLTSDAEKAYYNGRFGWAYEEEFGLVQAWKWSHDSKYIAFWQSDERNVPVYQITDYEAKQPEYHHIPYPKVGDTNPAVRIGVIDVAKESKQWMDVEIAGGYVPRLYWTSQPGQLAIVHLNREQTHLSLYFSDASTGSSRKVLEEKSDAWIDVFDFFAGIMDFFFFPKDAESFFRISEQDGWNHIYHYGYDGKLINQVTKGEWEVTRVEAVNSSKKTIYYTSTEESPTERHLYSIDFKGKSKKKLTREEGRHSLDVSEEGTFYLDSWSNVSTPTQVQLWSSKGKLIKTFEDNVAVKKFVSSHFYAPKELVSFTTSDGQTLDAHVIKPLGFDPAKKYPLLLNIYGGPGAQSVYNSFATNSWEQYLAQEGYIIVSVNNRGSGGYGNRFEKQVYRQLGKWESLDFVETARYFGKQEWVDENNIAIRGHSYGGYMAAYTALTHPEVFKVSLVGAPVTDWRLYDSIYAERYMGLADDNEQGYIQSSCAQHAGNLKAHMFIAHSAMDDNVHMQNTMQLVKSLIDAGKDHDLRIYPPGNHGVAYNAASYVLLYTQYTAYLNQYLK